MSKRLLILEKIICPFGRVLTESNRVINALREVHRVFCKFKSNTLTI